MSRIGQFNSRSNIGLCGISFGTSKRGSKKCSMTQQGHEIGGSPEAENIERLQTRLNELTSKLQGLTAQVNRSNSPLEKQSLQKQVQELTKVFQDLNQQLAEGKNNS